jgi:hypothetical protein
MSNVAGMRSDQKVAEAMRRSLPHLPAEARNQVLALLEPSSIAIISGTLLIWAGSHFFGVGEIVDVILLGVGFGLLGMAVFTGAEALHAFATTALNARTDADLDIAGRHFAQAVAILGISVISTLLLRKSARAASSRGRPTVRPLPNVGTGPAAGARLKVTRPQTLPSGALGETDWWGNIAVIRNQSLAEQRVTLYHEWVHRVLSPRFGPLRQLRAQLRASGYWRSALLRYLEEAMAESYAQLRAYGLGDMLTGLSFPITGGYVTVSQLLTEGAAIGNILVGGAVFHVVVVEGSWEARGPK